MTVMSDEVKLSICREFMNSVSVSARSINELMFALFDNLQVEGELSEEEFDLRNKAIDGIFDSIGGSLKKLHDDYAETMRVMDWHEKGCPEGDHTHDLPGLEH